MAGPPIVTAGSVVAGRVLPQAANDNEEHRISGVTAGFMFALAFVLDAIQVLFTLSVWLIPASFAVAFLAIPVFGVWFILLLGSDFLFGGKKAGIKMLCAFGSTAVELVPLLDAVPTITAGVGGIILASRLEDRAKHAEAANDNPLRAYNDNEGTSAREAA